MFKIVKYRQFTHEVTITTPVDGGYQHDTVNVTYRTLADEVAEAHNLTTGDGIKGFLKACLVNVSDLIDQDDKPVAWNDQIRDGMLADYWQRQGLLDGYLNAIQKAKAGN